MQLVLTQISEWPKLAWVAVCSKDSEHVDVYHGPMVEIGEGWLAEAVWDGIFGQGDLDRVEMIFGTAIQLREGAVTFVSSATGVECLWHCFRDGCWYVSNALSALLASADLTLCDDYPYYTHDAITIETRGVKSYIPSLPASPVNVNLTYYRNLCFDGKSLEEADKPELAPHFTTYDEYYEFLLSTAHRLAGNYGSPSRRFPIVPLVAISSGYDSPATAVVAREAGCRRAVTIRQSRSFWRGSDSGERIAERLGLNCQSYDHNPATYNLETTIWATSGRAGGLSFTLFDYPEPLSLLFSGNFGDRIWDRRDYNFSNPEGDMESLLAEFRIRKGMFQCVVPWWGIRRGAEIHAINFRQEMAPWTLNAAYDRPIARRIVEQAGVPRGTFGVRKKVASGNVEFPWPYATNARASFARYLRERGHYAPAPALVPLIQLAARCENLLHMNLLKKLGIRRRLQPWNKLPATGMLFQWASHELKKGCLVGWLRWKNEPVDDAESRSRLQRDRSLPSDPFVQDVLK